MLYENLNLRVSGHHLNLKIMGERKTKNFLKVFACNYFCI